MPRSFTEPRFIAPTPRAMLRSSRNNFEKYEEGGPMPYSASEKPRSFKDMFIGRPAVSHIAELSDDAQRMLDSEHAKFHGEGAGLVYIKSMHLERYAAKSVLSRAIITDKIAHLPTSYDLPLEINRGEAWLQPLPLSNPTVQAYHVVAPVIRTFNGSEVTQDPRLERAQLEEFFGLKETVRTTEMWLGYVNLPLGSGAEQDIADALDEELPDAFVLGGVQLYPRQPK